MLARAFHNDPLFVYFFPDSAERAKKSRVGKLTLSHLDRYDRWIADAKITTDRKAPILLPEYRGEKTLQHKLKLI